MEFCTKTAEIWQLVGRIVTIIKIAIPVIIIILGIVDLGKAAVSSKDDEMKKAFMSLMKRAIAGVLIFFIPTLVTFVFELVSEFQSDIESDYTICSSCVSDPSGTNPDKTGCADIVGTDNTDNTDIADENQ